MDTEESPKDRETDCLKRICFLVELTGEMLVRERKCQERNAETLERRSHARVKSALLLILARLVKAYRQRLCRGAALYRELAAELANAT